MGVGVQTATYQAVLFNQQRRRFAMANWTSPRKCREWARDMGAHGLIIEQAGIGVAFYRRSAQGLRWISLTYNQFQQWRRDYYAEGGEL